MPGSSLLSIGNSMAVHQEVFQSLIENLDRPTICIANLLATSKIAELMASCCDCDLFVLDHSLLFLVDCCKFKVAFPPFHWRSGFKILQQWKPLVTLRHIYFPSEQIGSSTAEPWGLVSEWVLQTEWIFSPLLLPVIPIKVGVERRARAHQNTYSSPWIHEYLNEIPWQSFLWYFSLDRSCGPNNRPWSVFK